MLVTAGLVLAACVPEPPQEPDPGPSNGASPPTGTVSPSGPSSPTGDQNGPLGTCPVFPADNAWNTDVSGYPVHSASADYIAGILASGGDFLHPDFGGGGAYGIPYVTVSANQTAVPVEYVDWADESDPGPFPIPLGAPIEAGGARPVIAVDRDACVLYELYNATPLGDRWQASNGARWDLRSNALRPIGWTSADAAGLPIFAGLVRYDEVARGRIDHALRFTVSATQRAFVLPATHFASSSTDPRRPPMGLRLRLRADYDLSGFHGQARVVLEALQRYGMIVADNGSNWFVTGAADPRWDDDDLGQMKRVPGSAFEVVDTGPLRTR
ncbi:MAG: hypothetical protein AMXMBFR46_18270 [Acidimicrobiia bacterium]